MRQLGLIGCLLLTACGQSGDLYLPAERPEPQAAPTAPATPPAGKPAEEKDKK